MLRTAGGSPACDTLGQVQSRTDDDFVRAVAAAVASDGKVQHALRDVSSSATGSMIRIVDATAGPGAPRRDSGAAGQHRGRLRRATGVLRR